MTTLPLLVREQRTGLVVAALGVAVAGMLAWAWTRRGRLPPARRRVAGNALVWTAGAGVVALLLLAGGDRPEPFLPLAAALLCGVAPLPRAGVRVAVQLVTVSAVAVALVQAGRSAADIALPLALLIGVAVVANALALHLAAVRTAEARARQDGRRRGELLTTVRELPGADPEAAAATACQAVRRHGFAAGAVMVYRVKELSLLCRNGEVDATLLFPADGPTATAIATDRTQVLGAPDPDDPAGTRRAGSGMVVPIRVDGQASGAMVAVTETAAPPTPPMREGAEVMAAHLGVVLSTAARVRRQRELLDRMTQLDRMRSAFVAEVSGELRHPLTAVRGFGQTLVSRDPDLTEARRRELLQRIADETDQLRATIDALLDFSRFQARRPLPVVASVGVVELLRPVAASTGARIDGSAEPDVEVDAALVRHALELLLGGEGRGKGRVLRIRADEPTGVELLDRDGRDVPVSGIVRSLAAQLLVLGGAQLRPGRLVVQLGDAEAAA